MTQDIERADNGARSGPHTTGQHVLSVVIPAYNEEDGIAEIVERVLAVGPALEDVGVGDLELIGGTATVSVPTSGSSSTMARPTVPAKS